jgi:predicted ATPase
MPQIAEAQALLAALAETEEVKASETQRQRLMQLQVAYGNALFQARGYGAPETTKAFARVRGAAGGKDASERLAADYGLWVGSMTRGELSTMRTHAAAFLRDVQARPNTPEAGVAYRAAGMTHWFAGEYAKARNHLERALALFHPVRDDDLAFRFAHDTGVAAMLHLAFTLWPLGEVERAISLVCGAQARIAGLSYKTSYAMGKMHTAMFGLLRGVLAQTASNATELASVARDHDLNFWRVYAVCLEGWVNSMSDGPPAGLEEMRTGLQLLREQNTLLFVPLLKLVLGEAEARAGDHDSAIATLEDALATSQRSGHRAFDAELHRVRGEILLKSDPHNPAPAEDAYQTAAAIARQQGTRSFELRAAVSLAKLCKSTGRPAEAHAVLAPALEGFSPTPEMPEIAEALSLLGELAETEEVEAAEAQRQRRLHLQTAYGQAMMWAKGFSAEETRTAFSRATELTAKTDSFADRFAAAHFQWTLAFVRGELRSARELELRFLKVAEDTGRVVEAGVARRGLALACYQAADFLEARTHCERALETCDAESERETQERFQDATGPLVVSVLAVTMWQLGEIDRARELIEQSNRRASELGHAPSMALSLFWKSHLEILRGDPAAALIAAEALESLGQEYGSPFWRTLAELNVAWARGRLHDAATGAEDLRRVLADRIEQGALSDAWFYKGLLAELEAETLGAENALARIDEAMALARQVETRCNLPFLHLLRGKLLLERDPSNPAPAEEAFQTALEIAKQQGARSWGLRAALSLAKLYQSTARPLDAHAILAPALEGFLPTPEMPEIADAQALLGTLVETDGIKAADARRERRFRLQTAYGEALMWSKGFAAEETRAAFALKTELATQTKNASRFAAYSGWDGHYWRGELREAEETAREYLREAETAKSEPDATAARHMLAMTRYSQGKLSEAQANFERVLADWSPTPNDTPLFHYRLDYGVAAGSYLALLAWLKGDPKSARRLSNEAIRRASELGRVQSTQIAYIITNTLEICRGDPDATLRSSERALEFARRHGLTFYAAFAEVYSAWARSRLSMPQAGTVELREAIANFVKLGNKLVVPRFLGLLAECEADAEHIEAAFKAIDEAFTRASETGEQHTHPFLHRVRGDILLKRDPRDLAPAEDAYRTAIAIAKEQGARSYELLASLSLAKLYKLSARSAEACAVLAPALEGFTSTPEMPEIAEAQALLERLAHGGEGAIVSKDQAT